MISRTFIFALLTGILALSPAFGSDHEFDNPILATASASDAGFVINRTVIRTVTELRVTRVPIRRTLARYKFTDGQAELITEEIEQEVEVTYEIKQYVRELVTDVFDKELVEGFDHRGHKIEAADLLEKLAEARPVVVSRSGDVIEPSYLQLLSEKAILLVINAPPSQSHEEDVPGEPPAPAPPEN